MQSRAVCWFCIFASEGSVKIISGLGARKYRERYTMVILNTHQHTSEVNIIENIHLHSIYLVDSAPLTIFLFLRQDLECCQYNNGCSQLSKLEELNMRDERRNGLKNILNEYLGQTMLAKIFPCRADVEAIFFLHQFQIQFSPILDKFPNCTKILVVRWGFTRSVDTKHDFYH